MLQLQSALGVVGLIAIAWLISERRGAVAWKQVGLALALTIVVAVLLLKIPQVVAAFAYVNQAVGAIAAATRAGTTFVFGYLGGGTLPYDLKTPGAEFVLAMQALPVLLVMSVLTTVLFYWRVLPPLVRGFSWALGAHHRRRRRGRARDRDQHFRRPCRGAAVHPPLSGAADAHRIVHRDDRRHGRHRRHRAGALCHHPRPDYPRRGGTSRGRLGARRAGGDPRQPDHGAGIDRPADRRRAHRARAGRLVDHGCDREGHRRRARAAARPSSPC